MAGTDRLSFTGPAVCEKEGDNASSTKKQQQQPLNKLRLAQSHPARRRPRSLARRPGRHGLGSAHWGLVISFGVFQTYYERELFAATTVDDHPQVSSSAISWIGSVQGALLMMGGVVSGPLFDMGHLQLLLATGHGLVVLGMFLTSVCTRYCQVLLAQRVCVGLGCGLLYLPAAAAVGTWFEKRRALAVGMQSVGSPVAGVVLPVIFSKLQPAVGFGWATLPLVFPKARVGPDPLRKRRAFVDWTYFSDAPIMVFTAAIFCAFLGLWVPFFYVQLYAIRFGVSSVAFSPYFVTLLNVGSAVGRILPPWAAVYAGSLHTILGMATLCAVMGFLWLGIASNFPGLVVFAVLYGVFQGGLVSMLPSSIVPLTPDLGRLGTRMGTNYLFSGLSVLAGTPIAGAILGQGGDDASWKGLIAYSGATLAAGSGLMVAALVLHRREKRL
ncbi:hypothetical protein PG984_011446 [Apiospora sp. TS-2023a]